MKKVIIIASAILFLILLLLLSLTQPKKQIQDNQKQFITPTLTQINTKSNKQLLTEQNQRTINNALTSTPYENEDFRFDYSPTINQLVVTEKNPQGKQKFIEWANKSGLSDLAANPELIVFQNESGTNQTVNISPQPSSSPFSEFLGNFINLGKGNESPTNNQLPSVFSSPKPSNTPSKPNITNNSSFVYYAQCDSEYSSLPLPDGCNMCQAGCGAATVSMIASSYLGSKYNPKAIIDIYDKNNYLLSCDGSRYSDAKSILQSLGLKTTDYITFDLETADQIVDDLKKYIANGWTFFTLANFKDVGGGHYFWITEIDEKGNVWAYDPYYGRFEAPPINENDRYPFPKYRLVFGVKK